MASAARVESNRLQGIFFGSGDIMTVFRIASSALAMVFCALSVSPVEAKPGAVEYGSHAKIRQLEISPNGGYVAMISNIKDQDAISISKVGGGLCNVGNGGSNIRALYWGNENRLIVIATKTSKLPDDYHSDELVEFGQSFTMNAACGDIKQVKGHGFLAHLSDGNILMSVETFNNSSSADKNLRRSKQSVFKTDIFKVDPNTGNSDLYESGKDLTQGWIVDAQGNARIRVDWDPRVDRKIVFARLGSSKDWVEVYDGHGVAEIDDQLGFIGMGPQPDSVYVKSRNGGDHYGIYLFDLRSKSIIKTVFASPKYDVQGMTEASYTEVPTGVVYSGDDEDQVEYFDHAYAQMNADLKATFEGEDVAIQSVTRDGKRYIAYAEGPTNPGGVYHYIDVGTGEIFEVGRKRPGFTAQDIATVRFFSYAARDGLSIPAYLTLPYGSSGKNLPMVVMPHGGPEARDSGGFDGWAQFLASRGYAVLQPQFRGSDGFGKVFRDAGHYQWGLKMQNDISDGVKNMIGTGVADASRICIVGWSYGGYAALAGMTFSPELYKCGVAGAPVSDLPKMLTWVSKRMGRDLRPNDYWVKRIGHPINDLDRLNATSPAQHAGNIRGPIMLIHGKNDTTVPFEQSEFMLEALTKAGKSGELVSIGGDDHYLSKSSTGIEFFTRLESFLGANLK